MAIEAPLCLERANEEAHDSGATTIVEVTRLAQYASAWDGLAEGNPIPSPFLRSWWLEAGGDELRFVLVLRDGRLIGGLALQCRRRLGIEWLRFAGSGPLCPDHLDLVAARDHEETVATALSAWFRRPGMRVIELEGAPASPRVESVLPGRVHREFVDVAPWSALPADLAGYRPGHASTTRKTLHRLTRAGVRYRTVDAVDAGRGLAALRELHAERWGRRSRFLSSFDHFAVALRAGLLRDEVTLHELVNGSQVIASLVAFEVAGRLSLYQSGRSGQPPWRGAGTVLLALVIERACRMGFNEVDLLRGGEPYKSLFAPRARTIVRLRAAHGVGGQLIVAILAAGSGIRRRTRRAGRATAGGVGARNGTREHARQDGAVAASAASASQGEA